MFLVKREESRSFDVFLRVFCVFFACFSYLEKGKKCVEKPGREKNLAKNGLLPV